MTSALTIPVFQFDPRGAVRALLREWFLPILGRGLAFAVSPFVRPLVREMDALISARSEREVEDLVREITTRNRRRAAVWAVGAGAWALSGGRRGAKTTLGNARSALPSFWTWWESERDKSAAPPELLSQMDVAVYSACRSLRRLFPLILSGAALPPAGLAEFARAMTSTEVFVAALIACLLSGRVGAKVQPSREVLDALVRRTVSEVDDLSRFVAGCAP